MKEYTLNVVPEPEKEEGIITELSLLVEGIPDEVQRAKVINTLFDFSRGHPDSFCVKFAVLLKSLTLIIGTIPLLVKKAFSSESKALQANLIAYQTSLNESVVTISKQAAVAAEQIESLKKEMHQLQCAERRERAAEATEFRQQVNELKRALPDVLKSAQLVNDVNHNVVWGAIGVAFVSGIIVLLVIQHLIIHLF